MKNLVSNEKFGINFALQRPNLAPRGVSSLEKYNRVGWDGRINLVSTDLLNCPSIINFKQACIIAASELPSGKCIHN